MQELLHTPEHFTPSGLRILNNEANLLDLEDRVLDYMSEVLTRFTTLGSFTDRSPCTFMCFRKELG